MQHCGMVGNVVINEGRDEVVGMVIAFLQSELGLHWSAFTSSYLPRKCVTCVNWKRGGL